MKVTGILCLSGLALGAVIQERKVDVVTSNYVEMEMVKGQSSGTAVQKLQSLHKALADGWDLTTETAATNVSVGSVLLYNNDYVVPITIGKQSFRVTVDTTSGDTWVVQTGYSCLGPEYDVIDGSYCTPGPAFNGTFGYGLVPGAANFSLRYGDDGFVSGQAGYDDITVAGVTVKKQEILLASMQKWGGNKITSGVLGMGYPLQTNVFKSDSNAQTLVGSPSHQKYDPVFTSMYKQGLVSPMFSLAMDRDAEKGWLAIGGLPPVNHSPDYAKTKIRMVGLNSNTATETENSYYTIIPDGFIYGRLNTSTFKYSNPTWNGLYNDTNASQFPIIIDSALRYSYLPRDIVLPYVRQFDGPVGRFDGQYWADCNAKAPPFGITVGGKTLYLNQNDLLQQDLRQERDYQGTPVTLCLISLMDTVANGPYTIGNAFLNAFVTVFDVGAGEMRFYNRK